MNDLPQTFSDLPVFGEGRRRPRLPAKRRQDSQVRTRGSGSTRRGFLRRAGLLGTALGLAMISGLPPARRAWANHPNGQGYQILDHCPSSGVSDPFDCLPGCGPSTVYADSCIPYIPGPNLHEHATWHKGSGYADPDRDYFLRPDQCATGTTAWDGWLWRYTSPCGDCPNSITRRCHDGWRCLKGSQPGSSGCTKSVCRWRTACT